MKKIFFIIIILSNLLLTGCFEYRDINRVIFVTAVVVDINEKGEYILLAEAFHSFRSNETNMEKGERLFFEMRGITLFDAARDFNRQAAFKVDYTQMKVVIVTERVAEDGLNYILDILERGQETILRAHILVTNEDPRRLLNFPIKQNEYLGLYLYELMENPFLLKMFRVDRINQYLNQRYQEGHTHLLTRLSIDENPVDARLIVDGAAIFVDDKLAGAVEEEEMKAWRFLTDRVDRGLLIFIGDFEGDDKSHVALDTVTSNTKTEIEYDGNRITLKKTIDLKTIVAETQGPFQLTLESRDKLEETSELVLRRNCEELFEKMKAQNLDIFDIGAQMQRKYPHVDIKDPIKITEIQVEVNNTLRGSSNTFGFR